MILLHHYAQFLCRSLLRGNHVLFLCLHPLMEESLYWMTLTICILLEVRIMFPFFYSTNLVVCKQSILWILECSALRVPVYEIPFLFTSYGRFETCDPSLGRWCCFKERNKVAERRPTLSGYLICYLCDEYSLTLVPFEELTLVYCHKFYQLKICSSLKF